MTTVFERSSFEPQLAEFKYEDLEDWQKLVVSFHD